MTDPAASTNSSSYRRRFRLVPVIEIQQRWAPALAVSVDSRPDQACDELWNRFRNWLIRRSSLRRRMLGEEIGILSVWLVVFLGMCLLSDRFPDV